jgi:hypothetical protein
VGRRTWAGERGVAEAGLAESGACCSDGRAPKAFAGAVSAMLDDAQRWRLAEMLERRAMMQEQIAERMGVSPRPTFEGGWMRPTAGAAGRSP